jgi:hypothetical protein
MAAISAAAGKVMIHPAIVRTTLPTSDENSGMPLEELKETPFFGQPSVCVRRATGGESLCGFMKDTGAACDRSPNHLASTTRAMLHGGRGEGFAAADRYLFIRRCGRA